MKLAYSFQCILEAGGFFAAFLDLQCHFYPNFFLPVLQLLWIPLVLQRSWEITKASSSLEVFELCIATLLLEIHLLFHP